MAAVVGKAVAKRALQGTIPNGGGSADPYFEKVEVKKWGIRRKKKQLKTLHPGLRDEERKLLTKVRRRAYRLDMALFSIPLIGKFGWSSVIGLIPVIGDAADSLMSLLLIRTCCSIEPALPKELKSKMVINLILDFLIGLVPLLGDIADAVYKCNTKNFVLLEKELNKRADKRRPGFEIITDPEDGPEYEDDGQAESDQDIAMDGSPPRYNSTRPPRRPEQSYNPQQPGGRSGRYASAQQVDLEEC